VSNISRDKRRSRSRGKSGSRSRDRSGGKRDANNDKKKIPKLKKLNPKKFRKKD